MTPPLNLPPLLAKNLRSLARCDGRLAARLCLPSSSDHLVGEPPQLHHHRSVFSLVVSDKWLSQNLTDVSGEVQVLGIGLGEVVDACLRQGCTVMAWERDPALVRAALNRWDWAVAIQNGRLRLAMGVDIIDLPKAAVQLEHPVLRHLYGKELAYLSAKADAPRALVCRGGLFVDDVSAALVENGFAVYPWDIHHLSEQELDRVVERIDPEVILAINYTPGLAEACHRLGRPLVIWEIDPSTDHVRRCQSPTSHVRVFTYRRAHISEFHSAGFRHVSGMPLAANIHRRVPAAEPSAPCASKDALCFVGASMADLAQQYRHAFFERWVQYSGSDSDARTSAATMLDEILAVQRGLGGEYEIPRLMRERFGPFFGFAC